MLLVRIDREAQAEQFVLTIDLLIPSHHRAVNITVLSGAPVTLHSFHL